MLIRILRKLECFRKQVTCLFSYCVSIRVDGFASEVLLYVMIFSCTFVNWKDILVWWMFDWFEPYWFWKCGWLQWRESDCCWLLLCTTFLAIVYIWKMSGKILIMIDNKLNMWCNWYHQIFSIYALLCVFVWHSRVSVFFHSFLSCLFPLCRIQRMSCVHVSVTWRRVPLDMALTFTQRRRNLASTSGRWMRTPQLRNLDFSPRIK